MPADVADHVAAVVLFASHSWLKGIFGYGEIATDIPFLLGVGTQNGPRYTLRFCRAFDGAHLAKRSERGGWRIGIGPEVIAGEIDMLPTER